MLKARSSKAGSALDRDDSDDGGERDSDLDASSDDARPPPARAPTKREPVKRRPQAEPARADGAPKAMDEDFREEDREPITLDDLNSVRVPRGWLEKWAEEPFFNNAVKGCFVRLGIGMQEQKSIYKVCEIVQVVDYKRLYKLGSRHTQKALVLAIGTQTRTWKMDTISNHRFSQAEFNDWTRTLREQRKPVPSRTDIQRRHQQMKTTAANHHYSADEISKMVADRQALARRQEKAGNIAIVNTRLRTELTGYQQQLEELRQTHPDSVMDVSSEVYQTVAKLQRKIKEQEKEIARVNAAEDKRRQNMQNSTSFQGWKEINDRARADNNTQDIAYAQLKKEAGAEAVSFEDNIFARRKTVPQMLWKTEKPQEPKQDEAANGDSTKPDGGAPPADDQDRPSLSLDPVTTDPLATDGPTPRSVGGGARTPNAIMQAHEFADISSDAASIALKGTEAGPALIEEEPRQRKGMSLSEYLNKQREQNVNR